MSDSKTGTIQFQWLLLQLDCMEELYKMHTKVNWCGAHDQLFDLHARLS